MPNIEVRPTANLTGALLKLEILEVSALIGTGGFALWQNELLPTVMAVGTIIGLTAWHKIHSLKDQKSNQTALPLSQEAVEPATPAPSPLDDAESVRETLRAIHDGDSFPSFRADSLSGHIKMKHRHLKKMKGG